MESKKDETAQDYHIKTIADILKYPDLDRKEFGTKKVEIVLVRFVPKSPRPLRASRGEKKNGRPEDA